MYESYWNLSERPFAQRIVTGRMYHSQSLQAASLRLKYCIDNHSGMALLIGQAGTGKSSLLRDLAAGDSHRVVHIVFPWLQADEMLRLIAAELRPEISAAVLTSMPTDALLTTVRNSVRQNTISGRHTLICIDDAHQLSDQVLLQVIQPLLNLCDLDEQLSLSLVLAGQPVLSARLRRHAQISDRVAVTAVLQGFSQSETADYLKAALAAAHGSGAVFTDAAVVRLFEITGGNPRRLNRLADMALLVGYAEQLERITETEIDAISHELMPAAA